MKGFKVIDNKTGKEAVIEEYNFFAIDSDGKLFQVDAEDGNNLSTPDKDRYTVIPEPDTAEKLTAEQRKAVEEMIVEALEDIYSDGYSDSTSNEPQDYCSAISKAAEIMAEIIKVLDGKENG